MKKFLDKVKANLTKEKIILVLTALAAAIAVFEAWGGKVAVACTLIVAFLNVLIYIMKNGINDNFVTVLANFASILYDIMNKENNVVSINKEMRFEKPTVEEYKKLLERGL